MTCSLAERYERLLLPKYPLARSSVARRCFLLWTARLTLAIDLLLRACGRRLLERDYLSPNRRSMRALSPPVTWASRLRRRVRFDGFGSSMWFMNALRRTILPVPVSLNRLAAPRWVFIFGLLFSSGRG